MSATDDVYEYLFTNGFFGGNTGWDGIRRRMTDQPAKDQLIVISEDGGALSEMRATSGMGDAALSSPGVQVAVRGQAWDGDATRAKATAIRQALHGQRGISLGSSGTVYFGVRAQTPEPVFAGFDTNGRPIHTISFRLLTSA